MNKKNPFIKKPCPFCGCDNPQFQKYKFGDGYLVKCPECWALTKVKQTWLAAYDAWEYGEWSDETLEFIKNPRTPKIMDSTGAVRLASAILQDAGNAYRWHLRQYRNAKSDTERKKYEYECERDEKYLRESPFIHFLSMSGDDVIAQIKRQVSKDGSRKSYRTIIGKEEE